MSSKSLLLASLTIPFALAQNPFSLEANKHLKSIHHPKSGALSLRLDRTSKPHRHRLGASMTGEVKLTNFEDYAYTAPILMGSDNQPMEVVWDTGSDWLTVEGDFCSQCQGNTYWNGASTTFEFLEETQSVDLEYGSASL